MRLFFGCKVVFVSVLCSTVHVPRFLHTVCICLYFTFTNDQFTDNKYLKKRPEMVFLAMQCHRCRFIGWTQRGISSSWKQYIVLFSGIFFRFLAIVNFSSFGLVTYSWQMMFSKRYSVVSCYVLCLLLLSIQCTIHSDSSKWFLILPTSLTCSITFVFKRAEESLLSTNLFMYCYN